MNSTGSRFSTASRRPTSEAGAGLATVAPAVGVAEGEPPAGATGTGATAPAGSGTSAGAGLAVGACGVGSILSCIRSLDATACRARPDHGVRSP